MIGRKILHYEIVEKLGQGGASVVYKARDTRLERFVALKFLTHLRASPESVWAMLLREARAISALSHPYIAALFDVAEADEEAFLVLEYLAGPTLRARIDQAAAAGLRLSSPQVATYALQMAQGLAHAHRRGVVHRDVKPSNAIFDSEGVLKLTDFGLAKLLGGAPLTKPGTLLGTVAYMSPEQAEGRRADERSDIFSLGIVLYEMLAGQPPFRGETEAAALYQIVHTAPPPLTPLRPDLPAPLEAIALRALEKKPEDRYPQMGLLVEDLIAVARTLAPEEVGGTLTVVPSSAVPASGPPRLSDATTITLGRSAPVKTGGLLRRRLLLLAGGALAVAAPVAFYWPFRRAPQVPSGSLLLLAGIENRSEHPEFEAVTDLLRSQLSQSAHLSLVDDASLRELLERMVRPPGQRLDLQTAREVAWRGKIPLIVSGRLDQLGSTYPLSLQLEAVGSAPTEPKAVWRRTFPAKGKDSLFDVIREASTWVRSTAGEAARDLSERNQPVEHTTTSSWEALRLFSQAEERAFQDKDEDAILLLEEAVKVDPDFAMAHGRLGDIYVEQRRDAEGFRHWRQAIDASRRRALTKREELRIKAVFAMDTGDFRSGESQFRTFCLFFPNDYYPHFYHAMALELLGRITEAIDKYRQAERLGPYVFTVPAHLAMARFALARFEEAAGDVARVRTLGQEQWARFLEGVSHFLRADYAAATVTFAALARAPDPYWRSRGTGVHACLLAEMGRYEEAARVLEEGIRVNVKEGQTAGLATKLLAQAWIHYQKGDLAASRTGCLAALQTESSPRRLRQAGALLARSGFPNNAETVLSRHTPDADLPVFRIAKHHVLGEIHLSRGNQTRALEEFRKADALEAPACHREYLARALDSSGDREGAFEVHRRTVESVAFIWAAPDEDFPGLWAQSLFHCARLARALGREQEFSKYVRQYVALTQHADPGVGHVAEARRMLAEAGRNHITQ